MALFLWLIMKCNNSATTAITAAAVSKAAAALTS
jgi:hypothetical protein